MGGARPNLERAAERVAGRRSGAAVPARAILIGWLGGLVDTDEARLRVLREVLEEEGVELAPGLLEAHPCEPPWEEWLERVVRAVRGESAGSLPARLMARAATRYRETLRRDGPAWRAGALDFLHAAAAAGADLGVVSTTSRREVDEALARAAVGRLFRIVVTAEDLEGAATSPSRYLVAMQRLNSEPPLPERLIHPHEVVAIEGTADGLRAAAAVGVSTVALAPEPPPAGAGAWVRGFDELDPGTLGTG